MPVPFTSRPLDSATCRSTRRLTVSSSEGANRDESRAVAVPDWHRERSLNAYATSIRTRAAATNGRSCNGVFEIDWRRVQASREKPSTRVVDGASNARDLASWPVRRITKSEQKAGGTRTREHRFPPARVPFACHETVINVVRRVCGAIQKSFSALPFARCQRAALYAARAQSVNVSTPLSVTSGA
jgi:hypothetical protein